MTATHKTQDRTEGKRERRAARAGRGEKRERRRETSQQGARASWVPPLQAARRRGGPALDMSARAFIPSAASARRHRQSHLFHGTCYTLPGGPTRRFSGAGGGGGQWAASELLQAIGCLLCGRKDASPLILRGASNAPTSCAPAAETCRPPTRSGAEPIAASRRAGLPASRTFSPLPCAY